MKDRHGKPSPKEPTVVIEGVLGWGNRKSGLESYGSGGRWEGQGTHAEDGDLLGDALEREGCYEGGNLIVICVPNRFDHKYAKMLIAKIKTFVANEDRASLEVESDDH